MPKLMNPEIPFQGIIDIESEKYIEGFSIQKAVVHRRTKVWDIYINTKEYVDAHTILQLEHKVLSKITEVAQIRICVSYPQNIHDFTSNYLKYWNDILLYIKRDIPSCSGWLQCCTSIINSGGILIFVHDETALQFLKKKAIDLYIENWIQRSFNLSLSVKFSIQDGVETLNHDDYLKEKEAENISLVKKLVDYSPAPSAHSNNVPSNPTLKNPLLFGKVFKGEPVPIETLREDSGRVIMEGWIFDIENRELKGGKILLCLDVTDYTSSITAKAFCEKEKAEALLNSIAKGDYIRVKGECQYDKYQREIVMLIDSITSAPDQRRVDTAEEKRIELHMHTQMSSMDAVSSAKDLIARASEWGHPAVAITDHGVLQAYPEAYAAGKKNGVKILFGVEAYLVNDCKPIVLNPNSLDFSQSFVVFDIETTGLDPHKDKVTEIGAVKIKDKKIVDSFQSFVNPCMDIPPDITKLTGITKEMTENAPTIDEILPNFLGFCNDSVLVAHNAGFDFSFIKESAQNAGITLKYPILDTLALARELLTDLKRHKLNIVAEHLGVRLDNHHRASDDARATGEILLKLLEQLEERNIRSLEQINVSFSHTANLNSLKNYHAVILVKNYTGLKNLYTLVSKSHLDYYYRRPRIPKSLLTQFREGLIIGSGCEAGELYTSIRERASSSEIDELVSFYDFLEIQPLGNNSYLIRDGYVQSEQDLISINMKIVELGEKYNKPVVATGDVHFLDPQDEYFRRILMAGQGFTDADNQAPLYFKTTNEMLEEFSYLGSQKAKEVVIYAAQQICDQVEDIKPIPDQLFPPEIPGAEEEITQMATEKAVSIYGDPLPDIVAKRLKKELDSIINNGFAVLYLIAHKLVKKSLSDGYLVGSRGSVGSSFVATMTNITEVNPLPPHYICPSCKNSDFNIDVGQYGCGADLPEKECPKCGVSYRKDGFDIPFEVFLGFKGDKVPDIDLNFSGDYQPVAHKYTEELFGEGHVFRAGTIGTIAEKTAFGFVKKYLDEKNKVATNAEIKRLVAGCTGVKRTTGQHPGGILVVPKSRDIYEFTPIQHPADDKNSGIITSHFDFHAIHDTLVKLDILGHDDPTVIRMLEDLTGVNARSIPIGEKKTMSLFSSTKALNILPEEINSPVGTFGIPEFGTKFVRQMLLDTKPTTFSELIRISGLSHGTDVWLNNAQDLVRNGIAQLSQVISTRDDIMVYLIYKGVEPTISFKIMESVRKGKGLTSEFEAKMREKDVPEWFIDSCKKIKYMFPKAHASAYVIMAFRIAYFKVYYPEAFYATYFTVRADDFDAEMILPGKESVKSTISALESKGNDITTKEKNLLTILEVALEMYCRGIQFQPIDLYQSDSVKFLITEHGIRPPLNALQGVGVNAARSIVEARSDGPFISIEDLRNRTKVTKTVIEILKRHGTLGDLPETSQVSLF